MISHLSWSPVLAGVPQGSILGLLLFLPAKLFADDTSIFLVVHDTSLSSSQLNDDLIKIFNWAYQWKCHLILR